MSQRRTIASQVPGQAFEPGACRALRSLGYEIVATDDEGARPELWIVQGGSLEGIALTRDPPASESDLRGVEWLACPVPFRPLYRALQRALEVTPRGLPRVSTDLPARCTYADRTVAGSVASLSEGGCLFRSPTELPSEPETQVLFALPDRSVIELRARTSHRSASAVCLAFLDPRPSDRSALDRFVMDRLLRGEHASDASFDQH